MADPWLDSVKRSGRLSVYAGASLRGTWATAFRDAISGFNGLSRAHRLGVTLSASSDPPPDSGGAHVGVEAANGRISFTYARTRASDVLNGSRMHGRTFLFVVGGKVEKAAVFLPSTPLVNTPRGRRPVGAFVMKFIAVHELVHACGLTDADHSKDDLFHGSPHVDHGDTPLLDKVRIDFRGRRIVMPPLILSSSVGRIRGVWA